MDSVQHLKQLTPTKLENLYNGLASYRFAERYVRGKSVLEVCWEEVGFGTNVLAETASSVESLTNSPEFLEPASTHYPAPNVNYQEADLPKLPYPANHFDVAVVFGVIENLGRPEDLLKEAKRVLKQDGLLVISTPDKQTHTIERSYREPSRRREMYVSDLQELLERHYEHVYIYRQGIVAGSLIFRAFEKVDSASVECARSTSVNPYFSVEAPTTRFVIAVCSDIEVPGREDQPYLLMDRDRRIFDEHEDRCEDVELLRDEIRRMQETEVQAFQEAYHSRNSEIAYLRAQLDRSEAQAKNLEAQAQRLEAQAQRQAQRLEAQAQRQAQRLEAQAQRLGARNEQNERLSERNDRLRKQIHDMENSATWRLFGPYRRLRIRIDAMRKPPSGEAEGSDDRRSD
jgi:O-antigen biosynthesis protein